VNLWRSYNELRKNLGRSYEELRKILRSFENRAPALLLRWQWMSEQRRGGSSVAAVQMSRSDYMTLYLGPVTVVGLRLGDWFEVKLTSFEFRCFRADMRPKTKPKTLKHFRPKTKITETINNCHFRCQKRKRNSIGLYNRSRSKLIVSHHLLRQLEMPRKNIKLEEN